MKVNVPRLFISVVILEEFVPTPALFVLKPAEFVLILVELAAILSELVLIAKKAEVRSTEPPPPAAIEA